MAITQYNKPTDFRPTIVMRVFTGVLLLSSGLYTMKKTRESSSHWAEIKQVYIN